MLVNKKTDDHKPMSKFFHSSAKLIVNVSKDDKSFGCMHKSGMKKIKKMLGKIGLLKQLWNMVLKFSSVSFNENNSIEK